MELAVTERHLRQDRRLLRDRDVADELSVSRATVWKLIKNGQLDIVRIGGSVRIAASELDRFVTTLQEK